MIHTSMRSLRNKIKKAKLAKLQAFTRGLLKAGLALQRDSQKIVPVETGKLKRSAYTKIVSDDGKHPEVIVGYSTDYALYVHEDLSKAHGGAYNLKHAADIAAGRDFARGENQQAKFLERPLRENRKRYIEILRKEINKAK